eukprot:202846_1
MSSGESGILTLSSSSLESESRWITTACEDPEIACARASSSIIRSIHRSIQRRARTPNFGHASVSALTNSALSEVPKHAAFLSTFRRCRHRRLTHIERIVL